MTVYASAARLVPQKSGASDLLVAEAVLEDASTQTTYFTAEIPHPSMSNPANNYINVNLQDQISEMQGLFGLSRYDTGARLTEYMLPYQHGTACSPCSNFGKSAPNLDHTTKPLAIGKRPVSLQHSKELHLLRPLQPVNCCWRRWTRAAQGAVWTLVFVIVWLRSDLTVGFLGRNSQTLGHWF
jgi:hypothetical protein